MLHVVAGNCVGNVVNDDGINVWLLSANAAHCTPRVNVVASVGSVGVFAYQMIAKRPVKTRFVFVTVHSKNGSVVRAAMLGWINVTVKSAGMLGSAGGLFSVTAQSGLFGVSDETVNV